jgi:hypothetical protein
MKVWISGALGLLLAWGLALAQEPIPVGEEFQVNSYTTSYQVISSVAADAQGNFVVVWESYGSYGSDPGYSIQGQRYDAGGTPAGSQFQINSYTTSYQWLPAVATDAQGNFVVVWESYGSYDSDPGYSIQGQRHDAGGTPAGSQFQVNSFTTSYQWLPAVATDPQGDFVVVWVSDGSSGTDNWGYSIQGQRYNASGTPAGSQFQVNTYLKSYQYAPAVTADAQGNFVVVWESDGSSGTDTGLSKSIQGQRLDASGTPVGGQFQVNSYTTNDQAGAKVAAAAQGNFMVVWVSDGSSGTDSSETSIQAQLYGVTGTPMGSQFQVNSYTTSYQTRPAVAADIQGHFVVAWASDGSYGTDPGYSIQAQLYDAAGAPVGGQFQVNSYTTSTQDVPAVAPGAHGSFIVAWQSDGSSGTDTIETSIQARRFSTGVIFVDGFESGDSTAWSREVP